MGKNIRWIIIFVSLFMIISFSRSVVDLWERRTIVEEEQKRLNVLEKKHEELTKKLEMVQTPAFVEKEARERLGMAKEGDTIIIMDDSSRAESRDNSFLQQKPNGISTDNSSGILSNWKRWWQIFF